MFCDKGPVLALRSGSDFKFRGESPVPALRRGKAFTFRDNGLVPTLRRERASRFWVPQGYEFGKYPVSVWAKMVVLCGVQSFRFLFLYIE